MPWTPAQADTLRCNGQYTQVGDSRLSVLHKCGQPLLADSYCANIYQGPSWQPVPIPAPFIGTALPCLVVDEWLYDRGPGHLMAVVRFQFGKVQSISYSRSPQ